MSVNDARPDLAELDRAALEAALAARGHERFRAEQIFAWIYRHGILDPAVMSDLPAALRTTLADRLPSVDTRHQLAGTIVGRH